MRSILFLMFLTASPALADDSTSASTELDTAKKAEIDRLEADMASLQAQRAKMAQSLAVATTDCDNAAVAWRGAKFDLDQVEAAKALSDNPEFQAAITSVAKSSVNADMTEAEMLASRAGEDKVNASRLIVQLDALIEKDTAQIDALQASMEYGDVLGHGSPPALLRTVSASGTTWHYTRHDARKVYAHDQTVVLPTAFDKCLGRNQTYDPRKADAESSAKDMAKNPSPVTGPK